MNPSTLPARSSRYARSPDNVKITVSHPDIPPRLRQCFAGQPEQVALARNFVARALAGCPAASDVILLTSELATNAVQHSATGQGGSFAVAICHAPGRVKVTVTDGGSATRPAVAVAAEELAVSGRGLLLVDILADRWGYSSELGTGRPARAQPASAELGHIDGQRLCPDRVGAVWFEVACC
ncbi:MAG: ATP-binding protein [Streptosporangiaceae bacterium]